MSGFISNPLYDSSGKSGTNPLYAGPAHKYPSQVIVVFLEGAPEDRSLIAGAGAIDKRCTTLGIASSIVCIRKSGSLFRTFSKADTVNLTNTMHRLNGLSRVYLQGHGDWQAQKIGAWGPNEVADLLADCGMPSVRVVSIDGCELGRDLGTTNTARISNSANSFASRFHKRLADKHGIRTEVHARVRCVFTGQPVGALVNRPEVWGKKFTLDDNDQSIGVYDQGHHRPNSKVRFYWSGGQQMRTVVP